VAGPRHPSLYQINTRVWLDELGAEHGRSGTLEDVPDSALDEIVADGFDWVWLLGLWQTGEAGRQVSLHQPEWQPEYRELLPDFTPDDVCGSPFAISDYVVNRDFGGPRALDRLRKRLAERGVKLMLDFVPNHTALDRSSVGPRASRILRARDRRGPRA
jgi:glycosidase